MTFIAFGAIWPPAPIDATTRPPRRHMRTGHARPGQRAKAAARLGREDADARCAHLRKDVGERRHAKSASIRPERSHRDHAFSRRRQRGRDPEFRILIDPALISRRGDDHGAAAEAFLGAHHLHQGVEHAQIGAIGFERVRSREFATGQPSFTISLTMPGKSKPSDIEMTCAPC